MDHFKTLLTEFLDTKILLVTLNRPSSYNAINSQMMSELRDLWHNLHAEADRYRVVILTGSGNAFCAGADLKERNGLSLDVWLAHRRVFKEAMRLMTHCPFPLIAAINGVAYGGGLELALACDFAYASMLATFAQSEVKIGLIPGALGTQLLPRACGIRRAKELAFRANVFSADEAYTFGLVNKICDPEHVIDDVLAVAKEIALQAPLAVSAVKRCINQSQNVGIEEGFRFENEAYERILLTVDREEGIRAFNEKRTAQFIGK